MTRDEGVAMIQLQLSFRTTMSSDIVSAMKLAQTTLELGPTKPWFLVSEDSFATLTADEERLPVPVDFLEEVEDATLKYRPADWPDEEEVDLVKDEYDLLRKNYMDVEAGPPEAYALLGGYFRFFPLPDDAYSVRLIYYKKATVLNDNVENGWLQYNPLLLLGSAGMIIAGPIRDGAAMKVFGEWVSTGLKLLHTQNVARDMANRSGGSMQMGGPHQ